MKPEEPIIVAQIITMKNVKNHFTSSQMKFLTQMYKESYKRGFISGAGLKKMIPILLFTTVAYSQSGIIASGNDNYTVGAGLVELQIPLIKQETLSVPKFELPAETPVQKPIVKPKKKSLLQSVIEFIKKLINKNK